MHSVGLRLLVAFVGTLCGFAVAGGWVFEAGLALCAQEFQWSEPKAFVLTNPADRVEIPCLANLVEGADVLVVFLHGMGGTKGGFLKEKSMLEADGIGWVGFDQRGHGDSKVPFSFLGSLSDLETLIILLKEVYPKKRLVVYGHSLGASLACTLGTTRAKDLVELVVSVASPSKLGDLYRMQPLLDMLNLRVENGGFPVLELFFRSPKPVGGILFDQASFEELVIDGNRVRMKDSIGLLSPTPVLLLHGALDATVTLPRALDLFRAASDPKEFVVFPCERHTFEDKEALMRLVLSRINSPKGVYAGMK